jgi:hypothetical protein
VVLELVAAVDDELSAASTPVLARHASRHAHVAATIRLAITRASDDATAADRLTRRGTAGACHARGRSRMLGAWRGGSR